MYVCGEVDVQERSIMEKMKMHTENLADKNYKILSELFPNALTETITGYDEEGEAKKRTEPEFYTLWKRVNTRYEVLRDKKGKIIVDETTGKAV